MMHGGVARQKNFLQIATGGHPLQHRSDRLPNDGCQLARVTKLMLDARHDVGAVSGLRIESSLHRKHVARTQVYELCHYRNTIARVIPERVLTKAPSAELKPDQKDSDSLPPYEELDPILRGYIEEDQSPEELVAAGHRPETVARVIQLVDRSEYKRRQAPPGVKITPRAFGRDRRMPIVNRYRPNGAKRSLT